MEMHIKWHHFSQFSCTSSIETCPQVRRKQRRMMKCLLDCQGIPIHVPPPPQKCLHFNFYQKNNFCLLLISLTFQLGVMAYFEVFSILPNHLKISVAAKSGSRIPEFNGHNNSICRLLVASLFQKEIYTLMFNNLVFYVLHLVY